MALKPLVVLGIFVLQTFYAKKANAFIPILETDTKIYSFSPLKASPQRAEEICHESNGHLLTFKSLEESEILSAKLKSINEADVIWTAGISYSNSTDEDLLIWSETKEPITFTNFHGQDVLRHRRSAEDWNDYEWTDETECPCPCSSTPQPFTRAPCKKPNCKINHKPCTQKNQLSCKLTREPECKVKQNNCTVDCSEQCRVVEQPVCTVNFNSSRCSLKQPESCNVSKPTCSVTPGSCYSEQDECKQEDNCTPVIRPCNYSCTQQDCVTISPPCSATRPPCVTRPPENCQPHTPRPGCEIKRKCRTDRKNAGAKVCENFEMCANATIPLPTPPSCEPIEVCPPVVVTCPPPVSSCTRPFVDCSPEICRSNVQICKPPKITCPSPKIICHPAKVECSAVGDCPEPEVFCEEPTVTCTKPKIECPDAVVRCNPVITTCGHAPVTCSEPVMECFEPEITCGEPVTCDAQPAIPYSNCKCTGKQCSGKAKRKTSRKVMDSLMLPNGAEHTEKTMCLAMKKDLNFQWVKQNCNVEHNFICQSEKSGSEKPKRLKRAARGSLWSYIS